jgi:uncharacterized protein
MAMTLETAEKILSFAFENTPHNEHIELAFFGGEPLLRFSFLEELFALILSYSQNYKRMPICSITTNGTIFSSKIASFIQERNISFCISCDGPSEIHDRARPYANGKGSFSAVEKTIRRAIRSLGNVSVNSVYNNESLAALPDTIRFLSDLGVRYIYLNPEVYCKWTKRDIDNISRVYDEIGQQYLRYFELGRPHFISLIDAKIALILRGGYDRLERCRMGHGEYAFAANGNVFGCERLIGNGSEQLHCIGNIANFPISHDHQSPPHRDEEISENDCVACSLSDYCAHWCSCSNYHSTSHYKKPSAFTCASERSALKVAFNILNEHTEIVSRFYDHVAGMPRTTATVT